MILAIDPGNEYSAYVCYTPKEDLTKFGKIPNKEMLEIVKDTAYNTLVIEMIASQGMPVGKTVFETCVWIGRFIQAWGAETYTLITRNEVKMNICGSSRANDSTIRQALIDRLGEPGVKKKQGPTYGIKADVWQALALAVTYGDVYVTTREEQYNVSKP